MSERIDGSDVDDPMFWSVALALLNQGLRVRFEAPGSSMAPFIRHGEAVTVVPCCPKDLRFGDIVLYSTSSDPAASPKRIHRLIKTKARNGKLLLITKGDALSSVDAPIHPEQVLGKVSIIEKKKWTLELNRPLGKAINLTCALLQRWPVSRWAVRLGWNGVKSFRTRPSGSDS